MKQSYNVKQIVENNLRKIRNRRKLSQLDLSDRTGRSLTYINNIENGKKFLSEKTLQLLCTALEAYPFEFFLTDDIPNLDQAYEIQKEQEKMLNDLNEVLSRYQRKGENSD